MNRLDQLVSLYTRLIGVNGPGDRGLDLDLAALAGIGQEEMFTSTIDRALEFLNYMLPDWQFHRLSYEAEKWHCVIASLWVDVPVEYVEGSGHTAPTAILSAALTAILTEDLKHWTLTPRATAL